MLLLHLLTSDYSFALVTARFFGNSAQQVQASYTRWALSM